MDMTGYVNHNYCAKADPQDPYPFCYTTDPNVRYEHCDCEDDDYNGYSQYRGYGQVNFEANGCYAYSYGAIYHPSNTAYRSTGSPWVTCPYNSYELPQHQWPQGQQQNGLCKASKTIKGIVILIELSYSNRLQRSIGDRLSHNN